MSERVALTTGAKVVFGVAGAVLISMVMRRKLLRGDRTVSDAATPG